MLDEHLRIITIVAPIALEAPPEHPLRILAVPRVGVLAVGVQRAKVGRVRLAVLVLLTVGETGSAAVRVRGKGREHHNVPARVFRLVVGGVDAVQTA